MDGTNQLQQRLGGLRILVVDDDEESRIVIAMVPENAGAHVVTADSAGAAFDILGRSVPDLVISDIGMPEEDGDSTRRGIGLVDIHGQPEHRAIPRRS